MGSLRSQLRFLLGSTTYSQAPTLSKLGTHIDIDIDINIDIDIEQATYSQALTLSKLVKI